MKRGEEKSASSNEEIQANELHKTSKLIIYANENYQIKLDYCRKIVWSCNITY